MKKRTPRPCKKIRHRTRGCAVAHLHGLGEPGMRAYQCKTCGFWHIGHASRMEGIQRRLDRLIGPDPRISQEEREKTKPSLASVASCKK